MVGISALTFGSRYGTLTSVGHKNKNVRHSKNEALAGAGPHKDSSSLYKS